MKAVRFHAYGDASVLVVEDVPKPNLDGDDVLVRVHAAGVNPIDWKVRQGNLHAMIQHHLPLTPGWDFAGVVDSTGEAVFGKANVARDGAYAEYIAVKPSDFVKKPDSIDFITAAAVPTAALTAWQSIAQIDLKRGQSLLILGGAGGVGSFAVQLAKRRGAHVVTTARTDNRDYLEKLGADVVVDYEREHYEDHIEKVDAVLDLVGGETEERSCAALKPGGVLASTVHPVRDAIAKKLDIRAITIGAKMNRADLAEIAHLIDERSLKVPVTEVMPLDEARRAHEISQAGHARGKIVLITSPRPR